MPNNPGLNLDLTPVNRYNDLIDALPRGIFYALNGIRIPFQGTKPYDLVIQTSQPLRVFGVFANGIFKGEVTTDSNSVARFSTTLQLGRNVVELEDDVTGRRIQTVLDARYMHVAHAALAQVIEDIDENIQASFEDRRLELATSSSIGDVWGKKLLHPNTPAYQHEAYREQLQEIHQAYRMWGGRQQGLDNVVGAVTTVTPFQKPFRSFGPRFVIGNSFLRNAQFQTRDRSQFTRASNIPGVTALSAIGASNQLGAGTLTFTFVGQTLAWTTPGGAIGPAVAVGAGGTFRLLGAALVARLDGRTNGPFAVVAATNDRLRLNIDGRGSIDITLTAGGAQAGAAVAADINAALIADPRYGAPYGATASVLVTDRIRLAGVTVGTLGSLILENIAADAYFTVFGYPWVRSTLSLGEGIGSTILDLVSSDDFPDANAATGTFRAWLARNTVREEVIEITANNRTLDQLTALAPGLVIAKLAGDTAEVLGAFPYATFGSANDQQGITVTVTLPLPGVNDTETVTLLGSNVSDFWLADNASLADLAPYGFFEFEELNLTNDGTGDTTLEAEADRRAFQYLEWPFTLSMWVKNRHTASINVRLGVNFGSGWVESGLFAIPSVNSTGGDRPRFVSFDTVLPATATRFGVRIRHDAAAIGQVIEVSHAALRQPNVTALSLGINTVPRSEHRAYLGELIYIWSPNALATTEQRLLGLPHATTTPKGHVDTIVPAHVEADRFDLSIYAGGISTNVRGAFSEAELFAGTLTNMGLTVRTPARRSFVSPSRISRVTGERLTFPTVAPFNATLAVTSNQNQAGAVLFENGISVPNNRWVFLSATSIQVTSGFVPGAVYTIDYDALIRFESAAIDLGALFADFVWYVDLATWRRYEPLRRVVTKTEQLVFNQQTFRATLADRSDQDKTATSLVETNDLAVRVVPSAGYRYLDNRTILIDSTEFKATAAYSMRYGSLRSVPTVVPTVTIERRRAVNLVALAAAPYAVTQKDAVLPAAGRFLQYRITIGSVADLRDFRLLSVGAKGLALLGAGSLPILK